MSYDFAFAHPLEMSGAPSAIKKQKSEMMGSFRFFVCPFLRNSDLNLLLNPIIVASIATSETNLPAQLL